MYNSNIKKELESKNLESNSYDYLYKYLKDNDLMDRLDDYINRLLSGEAVQYIIGNVYLRLGYNSGFDMTEKVRGTDYMNLDFDGHFILTPGYSITAQKRIYPSAWFQFRPYATVGVEYDLIELPNQMHYRFAVVSPWREYDIGVDPLWAHAGAGVEFLAVNGVHVGLDYRYQYNANVQMHKLQLSGMYRF